MMMMMMTAAAVALRPAQGSFVGVQLAPAIPYFSAGAAPAPHLPHSCVSTLLLLLYYSQA